jgi:hypothetical protein
VLPPTEAGPVGQLSDTSFIQRVVTTGGLAPATGCDSTSVDKEARVPYTADYRFWKKTP